MPKLKLTGKVGKRTENTICYHGRCGRPVIRKTGKRKYIFVRKKGGGFKKLYAGSNYKETK